MKTFNFIIICLVLSMSSCMKDSSEVAKPQKQTLGAYLSSLQEFEDADYFVLVSSVYNNSPMDTGTFYPDRVGLTIQGGEKESNFVGDLMVDDVEIPFYEGYYHNQIVSNPTALLGNVLSFDLNGSGFPSFTIRECSPLPTNMSFTGLDDYRIDLNGGVDVYWTPDARCDAELVSYIVIYADDNSTNSHFVSIPVSDADGTLNIDNTHLNGFNDYETLNILYMRGYQSIHTVSGKKVDLRFVQLSNTKFVIVK